VRLDARGPRIPGAGPIKLVAYLRVSTDRQAEEGLGLAVQETAIKSWTKANAHKIALWARDEGVSGTNGIDDREALPDALAAVRDGRAKGLVAYNLDRLARKLHTQEAILGHIWEAGGRIFTVEDGEVLEDDPEDPFRTAMRQMRGVFSQLERAMIIKRMKAGRRLKAERGGYAFGVPAFGYRAEGGELVPVPEEQLVLDRIRVLHDQQLSLRQIATVLTNEGHRTKRGGQWHPETLRLIVSRL
jgi:DNA invertase Pin-like site-specific DNA recombinase